MNFNETTTDGMPIIEIKGRIDSSTAKSCEDYLLSHVADGRPALILDLRDVDYISSAGLRVFVMGAQRSTGLGKGFALCNLQEDVAEVLEISGLNDILNVQADVAGAIGAVRK